MAAVSPTLEARTVPRWVRSTLWFLLIVAVLVLVWEAYKFIWTQLEWTWPVRPINRSMPHTWDIVSAMFRPARRGGEDILLVILAEAALFTLREAVLGFVIGGVFGFLLAVVFVRSPLAERSLMPYVVASQTVPIIAVAPMVVLWAGRNDWPQWVAVAFIASYLTFFPVTINTLRGLQSPDPTATELMRSYAARPGQVLRKLQVPAALPYIFTALKISATASVIGSIIGELPAGFPDGLGRVLLNFASTFSTSPEKLFATVFMSAVAGIVFVAAVSLAERVVVRSRPEVFAGDMLTPDEGRAG
ncbi:MAG: ABC transporter permease [Acidimicrobiia bacterium]|nr:ABC transporter permease [Acidimicrobiia bacterium]NNF10845.1 ABC transporter permease [Acidimicrobiia bacterium]NNL71164.1 ABC transporter permease [Acidimicrobiia bacterium]